MLHDSREPNTYFVERKSESLDLILSSLRTQHCVVISGLPGMGKTELASQFVRLVRDRGEDYKGIFWMNADSQTSFQTGVREMAREMCLGDDENANFDVICSLVRKELNKQDHWLLVLDNLDQVDVAKELLPEKRGVRHVIVTTRYRQASARFGACQIHLEKMRDEEAIEVFSSVYSLGGIADFGRQDVLRLVNELGNLPLAIIQAAAYLQETQDEISSYTDIYRSSRTDIWNWDPVQDESYVSVATVMAIAFEKIKDFRPAVRLLCLFAFLGPDSIPEVLWTTDLRLGDEALRQTFATKASLNKALQSLLGYSLLQRSPVTRSLSIHRLVQDIMRDIIESQLERKLILEGMRLVEKSPKYWIERAVEILTIAYQPLGMDFKVAESLDPHVSVSLGYSDRYGLVTEALGELLLAAGNNAWRLGEYLRCIELRQRSLQVKEEIFGVGHIKTAEVINYLGVSYEQVENYEHSIVHFTKALEIKEATYGKDHIETAIPMGNFGLVYNSLGRYDEALDHYQRELEIEENTYGIDHVKTAHTIKQLGNTFAGQGKFDLALLYKQ